MVETYRRRAFIKRAGGLAAGGLTVQALAACGNTDTANPGGGNRKGGSILWATNEAYGKPDLLSPFKKSTGIDVKTQFFSDVAEVTAKIKTGGTGISTYVDGSYNAAISHAMDILQPLDLSKVPNVKHLLPQFRRADGTEFGGKTFAIPVVWGTDSLAVRADKVGKVDDLAALWDPANKGKIAMPNGLNETPQVAAMYLGIKKPWDMTDDELAAVKNALLKQKPLVRTYWTEIGDLKNLFATGEVELAWAWVPVLELKDQGIDIEWSVPKQGQLVFWDGHAIPKGVSGQQLEDTYKFIDYTLGDVYGVELAKETGYRTTSQLAVDKMPADERKKLDFDDVDAFLANSLFFQPPTRPAAYQKVWNEVLNA